MKPSQGPSLGGNEGMDENLHPVRLRLSHRICNSQTWLYAPDISDDSKYQSM
jgi:hypothetical protein